MSSLSFIFVGLALSVFTWGLQYKLSLYDAPHSPSHGVVEAKLLSKNEQKSITAHVLLSPSSSSRLEWLASVSPLFVLLFVPLRDPAQRAPHEGREEERPWRKRLCASLNPFFFRPPPTLS